VTPEARRRALLGALVLLALGGLILHLRVHPYAAPDPAAPGVLLHRPQLLPATVLPLIDLLAVTALFAARRTAPYAYLLNGLIVIYGTVLMGHYSIAALAPKHPGALDIFLRTTFPDIAIAWGDFLVGKALYDSWMREA